MSLAASLCFFAYLAPMAQLDRNSRAIRGAILLVYSATLSPHTVRRWLRWWYEAPLDQRIGYHYSLPDAATSTSTELPISVTHSDLSSFTSLSPRWTGVRGSTSPPSLHDAGLRHDTGGVTLFLVLRLLPPTSSHDSAAPLSKETTLLVAMEQSHKHKVIMQPDPAAPGGTRILFRGFMVSVLEYLAQGLNFS
ncbi:hypothetical protein O3P69_001819 [Scylla paramamosain]|uniref:Uncharacterized protein n=1 Tax=Scylla paramamosain TaxID=85552 RepID=A0AAW0V0L0_SCYPA